MENHLPGLQENVPMKDHTTYRIGGNARYFFVAETEEQVLAALQFAKGNHLEVLVLGGGSNLLVADSGFDGMVIKVALGGLRLLEDGVTIEAGAGVSMNEVVDFSIQHSLEGIEWAGGLPGTFGGAIRGNAGAFGGEIKDTIFEVRAINTDNAVIALSNQACAFSYRNSIIKQKNWVVLSAKIRLKPGDKAKLQEIADARRAFRKERHPLEYPNSGSVFKNVPLSEFSPSLQQKFRELGVVKKDPFEVVPTAFLSSELGLKGTRSGNAQISNKHPNFLVNLGDAKAEDIVALIELKKGKVKEAYGVLLEVEVQLVGFPRA